MLRDNKDAARQKMSLLTGIKEPLEKIICCAKFLSAF